jgi:tRNA modification GTPase
MNFPTTIAALATAPGAAGVCVVRVSGPGALALADRLTPSARPAPSQRPAGTFFHAAVTHPLTGERLDDALVLVFRAPRSFTGEDTIEIQGHGGLLPPRRLLEAALAAGARLAEPGEFTRRAFLNGRLDLTQAEALCDFIGAETERAAQVARAQLDGALGREVGQRYEELTAVSAAIEHLLDFDENELPPGAAEAYAAALAPLAAALNALAGSWERGHLLRDGALVVICGRPNAGKSSLLNALLGRDRAIVHDAPGTTRDVIEERYSLCGVPLRLVDTAGLRPAADAVEAEGVRRAQALIRQADLILHLVDRSVSSDPSDLSDPFPPERTLLCLTKCDLPPAPSFAGPCTGSAGVPARNVSGSGFRVSGCASERSATPRETFGAKRGCGRDARAPDSVPCGRLGDASLPSFDVQRSSPSTCQLPTAHWPPSPNSSLPPSPSASPHLCVSALKISCLLPPLCLSAATGEGLDALKEAMARSLGLDREPRGQQVVSLRQAGELREAARQSLAARDALAAGPEGLVLAAGHARQAAEALGRLLGRVYSDDLLDAVFSRFCVGK